MYLMHKETAVAKLIMYQGIIIGVSELYRPDLLPVGMQGDKQFADNRIMSWIHNRMIPALRVNIDEFEKQDTYELMLQSHGVSLNDSYWFTEDYTKETWADVNLRDNGYHSRLHGFHDRVVDINNILSPDYTTPGTLEKYWFRKDGRDYLAKSGTMPEYQDEPVLAANEVVVTKIANLLNIPCVQYEQGIVDASYCCMSECFSKRNEDIVSGQNIYDQLRTHNVFDVFTYIENLGYKKQLDQMITLHTLVNNTDGHLSNISLGMDADTREYTRFVPLYDNGSCLGWTLIPHDNIHRRPLDIYLSYVKTYTELPELSQLINLLTDVYANFQISEDQTAIAIRTITDGYKTVQSHMQ